MDALAGPYAIAAILLLVAGVLELRRPEAAVRALAALGISIPRGLVRAGAASGVLVGVGALAAGGGAAGRVAAALVALAYAGFAGFVAVALSRGGPLASCGCFGRDDTPPTVTHLGLDLVAVVVAVGVVAWPGAGLRGAVAAQPDAGIPFVVMTVVGAGLAYAAFTVLPRAVLPRPRGRDPHG